MSALTSGHFKPCPGCLGVNSPPSTLVYVLSIRRTYKTTSYVQTIKSSLVYNSAICVKTRLGVVTYSWCRMNDSKLKMHQRKLPTLYMYIVRNCKNTVNARREHISPRAVTSPTKFERYTHTHLVQYGTYIHTVNDLCLPKLGPRYLRGTHTYLQRRTGRN